MRATARPTVCRGTEQRSWGMGGQRPSHQLHQLLRQAEGGVLTSKKDIAGLAHPLRRLADAMCSTCAIQVAGARGLISRVSGRDDVPAAAARFAPDTGFHASPHPPGGSTVSIGHENIWVLAVVVMTLLHSVALLGGRRNTTPQRTSVVECYREVDASRGGQTRSPEDPWTRATCCVLVMHGGATQRGLEKGSGHSRVSRRSHRGSGCRTKRKCRTSGGS